MVGHRARLGENRHLPISRRSVLQKTAVFSIARTRALAVDSRNYAQ